jgi:hypothetical protein
VLRVPHTDVPGDALSKIHTRPVTHHCGHMDEEVAPVLVMVGEARNTYSSMPATLLACERDVVLVYTHSKVQCHL